MNPNISSAYFQRSAKIMFDSDARYGIVIPRGPPVIESK